MTRTPSFHRLAERELNEAAQYYDSENPGLGAAFVNEVQRCIRDIQEHPEAGPVLAAAVRRRLIRRFPYAVLYSILAESEEIVITRHGKPAGVLIGFESEDDWFDYRLEHRPEFLRRVAEARDALRGGRGVRLEDLP